MGLKLDNIEWIPVVGYEDEYLVSSDGRIYSNHSNKVIKPKHTQQGYLRIALCKNGDRKDYSVHRIVATAFIPNEMNKPTVNHINEVKTDNRVCNLEWATSKEQNKHGTRTERAIQNTDWEARTAKMDYKKIAEKHDYMSINAKQRKPVKQLDKDGNLIKVYDGIGIASRETGISASNICLCAKGERETCYGYRWEYA